MISYVKRFEQIIRPACYCPYNRNLKGNTQLFETLKACTLRIKPKTSSVSKQQRAPGDYS